MSEEEKIQLINEFESEQTLGNLQKIIDAGLVLYGLKNNKWHPLTVFDLPFNHVMTLYEGVCNDYVIIGVGLF